MNSQTTPIRRGITLIESVISIVIVAVMAVAGLSAVGQAAAARRLLEQHSGGSALASLLLQDILSLSYQEKEAAVFGPEPGELNRSAFDDVDDFHAFTQSPPTDANGAALAGEKWSWSVSVAWVHPTTLATSADDQGVKLVTVQVSLAGKQVASVQGLCSRAWRESLP